MVTVDADRTREDISDIFVSGLHEAISAPLWRFLDQGLLRPARDEAVMAVWSRTISPRQRWCGIAHRRAATRELAVWREALTDEETGNRGQPVCMAPVERGMNAEGTRVADGRHKEASRMGASVGAVSGLYRTSEYWKRRPATGNVVRTPWPAV